MVGIAFILLTLTLSLPGQGKPAPQALEAIPWHPLAAALPPATHQPDLRQPDHPDPQGLRGTAPRSPTETENHCQFLLVTVPIARKALAGIKPIYEVFEAPEHLEFVAHEGGHVIEVLALLAFLGKHLGHEQ